MCYGCSWRVVLMRDVFLGHRSRDVPILQNMRTLNQTKPPNRKGNIINSVPRSASSMFPGFPRRALTLKLNKGRWRALTVLLLEPQDMSCAFCFWRSMQVPCIAPIAMRDVPHGGVGKVERRNATSQSIGWKHSRTTPDRE